MLHRVRRLLILSRPSQIIFCVPFLSFFYCLFFLHVPHASHFLELWIGIVLGLASHWIVCENAGYIGTWLVSR